MVCSKSKRNDGSDKWLIVEQSKKVKMKYVIENEQTGMVWDKKEKGLFEIAHWDNTDSQLWTLEPQGKGGYYNIRNVASGYVVPFH